MAALVSFHLFLSTPDTASDIRCSVDAEAASRQRSDVNKIFPPILRSGSLDQQLICTVWQHEPAMMDDKCFLGRSGSGTYSCVALSEGAGDEARRTAGNATILITESVTYLDKVITDSSGKIKCNVQEINKRKTTEMWLWLFNLTYGSTWWLCKISMRQV